jgi:hypothetical protein
MAAHDVYMFITLFGVFANVYAHGFDMPRHHISRHAAAAAMP